MTPLDHYSLDQNAPAFSTCSAPLTLGDGYKSLDDGYSLRSFPTETTLTTKRNSDGIQNGLYRNISSLSDAYSNPYQRQYQPPSHRNWSISSADLENGLLSRRPYFGGQQGDQQQIQAESVEDDDAGGYSGKEITCKWEAQPTAMQTVRCRLFVFIRWIVDGRHSCGLWMEGGFHEVTR